MNQKLLKYGRILAVAPSTRGVAFAVLEGEKTLVDWGLKLVTGDKNSHSLAKVKQLIVHYQPAVLVLENCSATKSRRSPRIRLLSKRIIKLAAHHKLPVKLFSREQVMRFYFADGNGTKHALAENLAECFPEELGLSLPPKRRPWMSEDSRTDMFIAVALVMALRLKQWGVAL